MPHTLLSAWDSSMNQTDNTPCLTGLKLQLSHSANLFSHHTESCFKPSPLFSMYCPNPHSTCAGLPLHRGAGNHLKGTFHLKTLKSTCCHPPFFSFLCQDWSLIFWVTLPVLLFTQCGNVWFSHLSFPRLGTLLPFPALYLQALVSSSVS